MNGGNVTDTPRLYLAATGHIYNGLCPDDEQPNARDKECPACRLLIEVERGGWKLVPVAQPAEGEKIMVNTPYDVFSEKIMVNTPYDVFILPLQPSGLSSGPRFVVHVPGPQRECVTVRYDLSPAQTESAIRDALIRMGWTPPDGESAATAKPKRTVTYVCPVCAASLEAAE